MAKYVYPSIFEMNELGGYCVSFPDVPGVYTEGKDLADAIEMAQDALCLFLYNQEERGDPVTSPSSINNVKTENNAIVTLISCDTNYYRRYFANKAVNKTVTIPARLNLEAEKAGINFSQVLRNGIEQLLESQASDKLTIVS